MKKLITILIAGLFTLASFGQSGVIHATGIKLGTGAGATTAYNLVSTNSYIIEKVGSTYYARPGIGTGYTAYSGAVPSSVLVSAMSQLTTGGIIYIKAGLYDNCDSITIPYDNISIKGAGKYLTKLKAKANLDVGKSHSTGLILCRGKDHLTISDLELDGNGTNQSKIDNGASITAKLDGICAWDNLGTNSDYLVVSNCYIHDFPQFGVCTMNANDALIEYCDIENNYWNNIAINAGSVRAKVQYNYCKGSSDVSISLFDGSYNTASDNYVDNMGGTHGTNNSSWGMATESTTTGHVIKNNTITGANILKGIYLNNTTVNCQVSGNTIHDLNTTGSGFSGFGIYIDGASYTTILGNKIYLIKEYGNGIFVENTTYSSFINNNIDQISDNVGFKFNTSSTYNTVIGNNIAGRFQISAGNNYNYIVSNVLASSSSADEFTDLGTNNVYKTNYGVKRTNWLPETGALNNVATATADGLTTGLLVIGSQNLTVTSANATYIVALPSASAATVGTKITGLVGANGFELRVNAAQLTTVYINGVTTNVECAIPASVSFQITQIDATHWIVMTWTALGAVGTAIIPDAL